MKILKNTAHATQPLAKAALRLTSLVVLAPLAFSTSFFLTACGQKGPLVLPDTYQQPASQASSASPTTTPSH